MVTSVKKPAFDPSSVSKWHDPTKLRQRGGIFQPSRENTMKDLLLSLPKGPSKPRKSIRKSHGKTPRKSVAKTPRSVKTAGSSRNRKSTRGRSHSVQSAPTTDQEEERGVSQMPDSSPLGPRSSFNRAGKPLWPSVSTGESSRVAGLAKTLFSDADDDVPGPKSPVRRSRRTPTQRATSELSEDPIRESLNASQTTRTRPIKFRQLAPAPSSDPVVVNLQSSVQRSVRDPAPLSPVAESPSSRAPELAPSGRNVERQPPEPQPAPSSNVKVTTGSKKRKAMEFFDDSETGDHVASPPKRSRKAPTKSKTSVKATLSAQTADTGVKQKREKPAPLTKGDPTSSAKPLDSPKGGDINSDDEPLVNPSVKAKGKRKAIEIADGDDDGDVDRKQRKSKASRKVVANAEVKPKKAAPKKRSKAKSDQTEDEEDAEKSKKRARKAAPSRKPPAKRKKKADLSDDEDDKDIPDYFVEVKDPEMTDPGESKAAVTSGEDQVGGVTKTKLKDKTSGRMPGRATTKKPPAKKVKAKLPPPRPSLFVRAAAAYQDEEPDPMDLFG